MSASKTISTSKTPPSPYQITDFLIYSPREELYVSDSLGRILAVSLSTGSLTETHSFYSLEILKLSFSPNQSYLAILYSSGCVQIVNSQSFMVEMNLIDHQQDPLASAHPASTLCMREDLSRMKEVASC